MAIQITCPECNRRLKVQEEVLGKRIRCPACKSSFIADDDESESPGDDSAPPKNATGRKQPLKRDEQSVRKGQPLGGSETNRHRRRTEEEEEEEEQEETRPRTKKRKKASKSGPPWLLIGGGVGAAVVLVIGILFAVGAFSGKPATPVAATNPDVKPPVPTPKVAPPPAPPIVRSPRMSLPGHRGRVACLAVSRDGKTLVSVAWDKSIRVWDVGVPKERRAIPTELPSVYRMALAQDDKTVVIPGHGGIHRWSVESGEKLPSWEDFKRDCYGLAVSPDGNMIAIGTSEQVETGKTQRVKIAGTIVESPLSASQERYALCDVSTGEVKSRFKGTRPSPSGLAFLGDGKRLASITEMDLTVWDLTTGQPGPTARAHNGTILGLASSRDGSTLATGGADRTVKLWESSDKALNSLGTLTGQKTRVGRVAFSRDGQFLAAATGDILGDDREALQDEVRIWDVAKKEARAIFTGQRGSMTSVAFTNDGKTVITGGQDGVIRFWDIPAPGSTPGPAPSSSGQTQAAMTLVQKHKGRFERQGEEILVLDLAGSKVVDAELDSLKGLQYLKTLRLDRTSVSDAGLDRLKGLSQLEQLSIVQTQVTDTGAAAFKKAIPGCFVSWSEDDLNNAMANSGNELPAAIVMIGGVLTKDGNTITKINLGRSKRRITDAGLKHLKGLPDLKELHLYSETRQPRNITDAGLEQLGPMPTLENIGLQWTKITDKAITRLPQQFPNLKVVALTGTSVTDRSVESLIRLEKLEYVALDQSKMTAAGAEALRRQFPKASILGQ